MKDTIKRNRYKIVVVTFVLGVMLLFLAKLYMHSLPMAADLLTEGFSLSFLKPLALILFLILMIGFLVCILWIRKKKIEQIFLFLGILFGIIYMIFLPPYTVPDEAVHIDTSYYFSSIILGEQAVDENGFVVYREGDTYYNHEEDHVPTAVSYGKLFHDFFALDHSEGTAVMGRSPLTISAVAYIPQIIGVTLARLFHLGNVQMLLFGRLFALAFYLACVYVAIRIMPLGKEVLLVAGLMPTTLQMAASFSYDSTVLALCFLYTGILMYLTLEAERVRWYHWGILGVIFTWMAPIKVVYLGLAATLLIVPRERFGKVREKYLGVLLILVVGAAVILMTRIGSVTAFGIGVENISADTTTFSVSYLMSHPTKLFGVLYGTIALRGGYYLESMIGQYLGWLEIMVPEYLIYGFYTLLILAAIRKAEEKQVLSARQRLWIFLVVAGVCILVGAALLLSETSIGAAYVYGIQGRYFLPLLPLLLVLCKNWQIEMRGSMTRYIAAAVYVLQFFTVFHIFETIIER